MRTVFVCLAAIVAFATTGVVNSVAVNAERRHLRAEQESLSRTEGQCAIMRDCRSCVMNHVSRLGKTPHGCKWHGNKCKSDRKWTPVSYTHLTLPTIYSV